MLARSRAIDRMRARIGQRREVGSLQEALQLASAAPGPLEDAIVAERRRIVVAALDALPAEQRTAIELAYYGGKSHREIAAALDLPLGTVKTRIRIGMTRLRDALAPSFAESR
jgi:RNA polymerase sigma-70 factor (ECF subfamily)